MAATLAAVVGVLLAALDRPGAGNGPSLKKISVGVLAAAAVTLVAGIAAQLTGAEGLM